MAVISNSVTIRCTQEEESSQQAEAGHAPGR
jgi:hypothetical protein